MATHDWGTYLGSADHHADRAEAEAQARRVAAAKAAGTHTPQRVVVTLTAAQAQRLLAELHGRRGHLGAVHSALTAAYADAR